MLILLNNISIITSILNLTLINSIHDPYSVIYFIKNNNYKEDKLVLIVLLR